MSNAAKPKRSDAPTAKTVERDRNIDETLRSVSDELEEQIVHDHRELAEAIIAGDSTRSGQLMRDHVRHIVEDFKAYWPRKVGEKVQWR